MSSNTQRRRARLALALVLALLAADRVATGLRRGDRPIWQRDGSGEAALTRGLDGWTEVPALPIGAFALGNALLGPGTGALLTARALALIAAFGGLAAFLWASERRVWVRPWATAAAAVALAGPPAFREWALNASGEAYGVAALLAAMAVGMSAGTRRSLLAAAVLGFAAAVSSRIGPGVALVPLVGGLLAGRGRPALRASAATAAGWMAGAGLHLILLTRLFGSTPALGLRGGFAPLAASPAEWWIPPAVVLTLGALGAGLHPDADRRRGLFAALAIGTLAVAGRGTFLPAAAASLGAVAAAAAALRALADDGRLRNHLRAPQVHRVGTVALAALAVYGGWLGLDLDPAARLARNAVHALSVAALAAATLGLARLPGITGRRDTARNAALAAGASAALLLLLEIVFSHVPRSHGIGYTLAARLWSVNLLPQNAAGFRDAEYTPARGSKPHRIAVVGDSFAEGGGVADVSDRFANVLAARLPADHEVFVLAKGGADTADEVGYLERFPWDPEVVVVSYYANDIEGRARARLQPPRFTPYLDVPEAARGLVRRSYLLNFVYWLLPHGDADAYRTFLKRAYEDADVLREHLADLDRLDAVAERRGARVVFVLFPFLDDAPGSAFFLRRVEAHVRERGREALNVADLVRDLPLRQRIVNAQDAHPSPAVHRLVGDALYALIAPTR